MTYKWNFNWLYLWFHIINPSQHLIKLRFTAAYHDYQKNKISVEKKEKDSFMTNRVQLKHESKLWKKNKNKLNMLFFLDLGHILRVRDTDAHIDFFLKVGTFFFNFLFFNPLFFWFLKKNGGFFGWPIFCLFFFLAHLPHY